VLCWQWFDYVIHLFQVNPEETLRVLVPHLCDTVLTLVDSDDILGEEILDNELLYNLLLLSEVRS
jgi:hypothetical protein